MHQARTQQFVGQGHLLSRPHSPDDDDASEFPFCVLKALSIEVN
jgi:hypothetical protein